VASAIATFGFRFLRRWIVELRIEQITKAFGPVIANDGVSFTIEGGTIHGILGENGAGKSTLMKILSGYQEPDSGQIFIDGMILRSSTPADALRLGVAMLHQDPLDFPDLSIMENLLLGSPGPLLFVRKSASRTIKTLAQRLGFQFDFDATVGTLTVGERQQLELVRLLWLGAQVLILDEPTTGISTVQRDILFAALRQLANEGKTVVLVSHKLTDVEELCDQVTVMRHGRVVGQIGRPLRSTQLVSMMFGETLVHPANYPHEPGETILTLQDISIAGQSLDLLNHLAIHKGEVIGLAGIEGSGQRDLLLVLAGLLEPSHGMITVGVTKMRRKSTAAFVQKGIVFLPAGRIEEGLFPRLTIAEHFELARVTKAQRFGSWSQVLPWAQSRIAQFSIKGRPTTLVENLSGGNQQRTLLAMLPDHPSLMLLEHPTRGLDVQSANWIWQLLHQRRCQGSAIVFISDDLDEILEHSNRIAVFFEGRMIKIVDAQATTSEELGYLIGGKNGA
jgi:simple sugar transport system ATP-binding protein